MLFSLLFLCYLIVPGSSEILSCAPSTTSSKYSPNGLELDKTSACIVETPSNYTFHVSQGPKFVRLHFYPISYSSRNISKALFNVSAGRFTLLSVSKSSYSKEALDAEYMIKEYYVPVEGHVLNILFTPSSDHSDAYGFVNMIEVVSVLPKLYLGELRLPLIGHPNHFRSVEYTALETFYRVNVGGSSITSDYDYGMSRSWSEDRGNYLFRDSDTDIVHFKKSEISFGSQVPYYIAPKEVYSTARKPLIPDHNLTWSLSLDSGFCYLIRFHLYNQNSSYYYTDKMVVHIYTNYTTYLGEINLNQDLGVPGYRDFLVNISEKKQGILFLSIYIQANRIAPESEPFLNGFEIFKLSDDKNSLAGPFPFKARKVSSSTSEGNITRIARKILLFMLAAIIGLPSACICCTILLQKRWCSYLKWNRRVASLKPLHDCKHFSLAEIKLATNYFSDALLLGSGGFGKVYKGCIISGTAGYTTVAIKRATPNSHQGLNEFQTEIATLSKLRHCHLVSLIGCCMEEKEMILVYNFMAGGTLRDHLYKTKKTPLPWKQRLKICIGAARGLHYLHTGGKQTIIHRDVKTTNILLDENHVAKVSDFGLSKIGPNMMTESETHVSTMVKGSFGYLDPEYYRRQKLTEKSDVYSFGVVLLEVLFARPAVLPQIGNGNEQEYDIDKVNLAEWAMHCYRTGTLAQNIDPSLQGHINPECFQTFSAIAMNCLEEKGSDRPGMGEVLCNLELAWQQQHKSSCSPLEDNNLNGNTTAGSIDGNWRLTVDGQRFLPTGYSDPTPGAEFSEIIHPTGR